MANQERPTNAQYRVGPLVFHAWDRTLWLRDEHVRLAPLPSEILLLLVQSATGFVARSDVVALWQQNHVAPGAVRTQVSEVNAAFRRATGQNCIRAMRKKGYQLLLPVRLISEAEPVRPGERPPEFEPPTNKDAASAPVSGAAATATPAEPRVQSNSRAVATSVAEMTEVAGSSRQDHPLAPRHPGRPGLWLRVAAGGTMALAIIVSLSASGWLSKTESLLRLGLPRALTDDGVVKAPLPLLADTERLIYSSTSRFDQVELRFAGGGPRPLFDPTAPFVAEDLHPIRGEYLARKLPAPDGMVDLPLWIIPVAVGIPRRVGDVLAEHAAWSPDGREIVIVRSRAIEIVRADGSLIRRLLMPSDDLPQFPRWSPDGRLIRFTRSSVVPQEGYRDVLWEVRTDGTGLRPLPYSGEPGRADCCGVWLDHRRFVYRSRYAGKSELRAVADDGTSAVTLTAGDIGYGAPAVSPDGSTLYAIGWPTKGELVTFDLSRRSFIVDRANIVGTWVTYAPESGPPAMAFVSYPDEKLWRSKLDGSDRRQLVGGPFEVDGATWSPDNRTIAFRSRMGGTAFRIYLVSTEGGVPKPISYKERSHGIPSWGPTGRKLIFGEVPAQYGHPDGNEALWVYDLDTNQTTAVPGSRGRGLWSPRWSQADGTIAAIEILPPHRIHIFDLKTGHWRLLPSASQVDDMQWTRDGAALIYRTQGTKPGLKRVTIKEGRVTDLVDFANFVFAPNAYGWFGLAPDDSPMLLRNRGATEVYAFKIEK